MSIKWNKINWKKYHSIFKLCGAPDNFDEKIFWSTMESNSKQKMIDGMMPSDFTWEKGFKCGFPNKEGIYLGYFSESKSFEVVHYDEETQDHEPCFWDNGYNDIVYPTYWAKIELPKKEIGEI